MPGATSVAWGGATLTVTVGGVDVSCDVLECAVDRSRGRVWDPPDAGTAQITLDLTAGGQPASRGPVGSTVRVQVAYGARNRYLFTGAVQSRHRTVDAELGDRLVLDCVDGFETLSRVNRRAATEDSTVGAGDSIADRIGRWLDVAGWPSSSLARALDLSDFTAPPTLLDGNALLQIQAAAFADGGDFFIDGAGVATFKSWNWRTTDDDVVAIFSDRRRSDWVPYSTAQLLDNLDEVQNKVAGTRRDLGELPPLEAVTQYAESTSSIADYGERGDALDSLELETDAQVATRVGAVVTVAARPNTRFDAIVVQPAFDPVRSWPYTIPVTFASLIAANRIWSDGTTASLYGHVIGEQWRFTADDVTVEYRVSGTGTWDGTRPARPPIAVEITPAGCIRVPEGYPCDDTSTVIFRDADGTVIATYPPGSLCGEGICDYPPDAVEVCLVNPAFPDEPACTPIADPRLTAIFWFDVSNTPPALLERIEGLPVDIHPDLADTTDDIVGSVDAITVDADGGTVGAGHSGIVGATSFNGGYRFDWWMALPGPTGPDETIDMIDFATIAVRLTTAYQTIGPYHWDLELVHLDDDGVQHFSGPLYMAPGTLAWHHYVLSWDPPAGTITLLVDGVEV